MQNVVLVEDLPYWRVPYEKALAALQSQTGWKWLRTFDNREEAVDFIVTHKSEVNGLIIDMRIRKTIGETGPVDLKSDQVQGILLIEDLQRKGLDGIPCVAISVHFAGDDPVKQAIEEALNKFKALKGAVTKGIDAEVDVRASLELLTGIRTRSRSVRLPTA